MNFLIAWQKINQQGRDFMALLPNLLFGVVVLVVFVARGVRAVVVRVVASRQQSQSLTLLLSRLASFHLLSRLKVEQGQAATGAREEA